MSGILEKLGLVDDVTTEEELTEMEYTFTEKAPTVTIPTDLDVKDVVKIEDVYIKFDLADKTNSIFKIEELKMVLDESMTIESKRKAVLGFLTVANLKLEDLLADGDIRTEALTTTLDAFFKETSDILVSNENEILILEDKIEQLKKVNAERKKAQEIQVGLIDEETKKIGDIKKFINPSI